MNPQNTSLVDEVWKIGVLKKLVDISSSLSAIQSTLLAILIKGTRVHDSDVRLVEILRNIVNSSPVRGLDLLVVKRQKLQWRLFLK